MRSAYVVSAASMSSPLLARWNRSHSKPTLCGCTRSRTATTSLAVRSGYGLGPLTGSTRIVPAIEPAAFGGQGKILGGKLVLLFWGRLADPVAVQRVEGTNAERSADAHSRRRCCRGTLPTVPGIDNTPQSGPARSPAKKFSPISCTPASRTAVNEPSISMSAGTGVSGQGHQNSIGVKAGSSSRRGPLQKLYLGEQQRAVGRVRQGTCAPHVPINRRIRPACPYQTSGPASCCCGALGGSIKAW